MPRAAAGSALPELVAIMDRLRTECPWDARQTHESLAPYLLEETYEALEALERRDMAELRGELGDVLLQVLFHARVAAERTDGTGFTIDDVASGHRGQADPQAPARVRRRGRDRRRGREAELGRRSRPTSARPPPAAAAHRRWTACRWASRRSRWPPSCSAGHSAPARPPNWLTWPAPRAMPRRRSPANPRPGCPRPGSGGGQPDRRGAVRAGRQGRRGWSRPRA